MSKVKSARFGEYIVSQNAEGEIKVVRNNQNYDNVKSGLREISAKIGFKYDPEWNTRKFGRELIDELNKGGDTIAAQAELERIKAETAKSQAEAEQAAKAKAQAEKDAAEAAKAKAEAEKQAAEAAKAMADAEKQAAEKAAQEAQKAAAAKSQAEAEQAAKAKAQAEKDAAEAAKAKAEAEKQAAAAAKAMADAEKQAAEKAAQEAQKAAAAKDKAEAAAAAAKASTSGKSSAVKGALPGLFSVSKDKKVRFSMGNLQFNAKKYEFRFAEHQWDMIGEGNKNISPDYDGWIDLFGYGTSGYMGCQPNEKSTATKQYIQQNINGTLRDWGEYNPIENGGNKEGQWRTLTVDEWRYVLENRKNAEDLNFLACVNDVNGLVLLPDDFSKSKAYETEASDFSENVIDAVQWKKLEDAGAVLLPAAGCRVGNSLYETSSYGNYWSSSIDPQLSASGMFVKFPDHILHNGGVIITGQSVRLVKEL